MIANVVFHVNLFRLNVIICQFLQNFDDIHRDVGIVMAEETTQTADSFLGDEFWVIECRVLAERKKLFNNRVKIRL